MPQPNFRHGFSIFNFGPYWQLYAVKGKISNYDAVIEKINLIKNFFGNTYLYQTYVFSYFLQATYESRFPFFDFDSDMEAWTVARAFAKEPWSREYFDGIRK